MVQVTIDWDEGKSAVRKALLGAGYLPEEVEKKLSVIYRHKRSPLTIKVPDEEVGLDQLVDEFERRRSGEETRDFRRRASRAVNDLWWAIVAYGLFELVKYALHFESVIPQTVSAEEKAREEALSVVKRENVQNLMGALGLSKDLAEELVDAIWANAHFSFHNYVKIAYGELQVGHAWDEDSSMKCEVIEERVNERLRSRSKDPLPNGILQPFLDYLIDDGSVECVRKNEKPHYWLKRHELT